jgi:hypothetical protein
MITVEIYINKKDTNRNQLSLNSTQIRKRKETE